MAAESKKKMGDGQVRGLRTEEAAPLILALLAVLTVAVFDPFGWDHFGPIRWMAVPALGFAAIALSIEHADIAAPRGRKYGLDPNHLWAGLLLWGFIATLAAADPLHTWIGTPDRRFGWLIWLLCGGLFLVCRGGNVVWTEATSLAVSRGIALGGVGLGLYTVAELANLAIDVEFAGGRAGGPFGQPAYLGAAAVLVLPVAIGVAVESRKDQNRHNKHGQDRVLGIIGVVGALGAGLALLASQSRAAWLGALATGTVWAAFRLTGDGDGDGDGARKGTTSKAARPVVAATVIAPVVLILAVPALRSRLTSSFGQGGVVQGRIDEWQVGLRALVDAPFFGYGPEGYRIVFGRHVDQQYVIDWGREVITDRAHAGLLDVGLIFGIPGALTYLGLMVTITIAAIRAMRSGRPRKIGLGAATLAYAVQQQFFFPVSEIDPLFWIIAGLTTAAGGTATATQPATTEPAIAPSPVPRQLGRGLALGLAAVALLAGLADMAANISVRSALVGEQGSSNPAVDPDPRSIDTASNWRPDSVRYRFIASRVAGRAGDLDLAIDHIERALQRSADDPALRAEQGRLLLERARNSAPGPSRTDRLVEATTALKTLVEQDPNHPEHLQRLGIALALAGDFDDAVSMMERAIILAPDQPAPVQNLSEIERLRQLQGEPG